MSAVEVIGWIGSVAFAVSAVPAAWAAWQAKACTYNVNFLLLWGLGEACMIVYALGTSQPILLLNYVVNAICLIIIAYYTRRHHVQMQNARLPE